MEETQVASSPSSAPAQPTSMDIIAQQLAQTNQLLLQMMQRIERSESSTESRTPGRADLDHLATTRTAFAPRVADTRRSSMIHPEYDVGTSPTADRSNPVSSAATGISVVVSDRVIADKDKMQHLTLKAILYTKQKFSTENAGKAVKVLFQQFISAPVLEKLWNKEKMNKTEFSWSGSYEGMLELQHERFMKILSRAVMPESSNQYWELMIATLPQIKPTVEFSDPNYDETLFPVISAHFDRFQEADEFIRYGATTQDNNRLPRYELGKDGTKEGPGVFGMAIALLGDYADIFKSLCGIDNLKRCENMDAFLKLVNNQNQLLADHAKNARIEAQQLQPKMLFKSMVEQASAPRRSKEASATPNKYQDPRRGKLNVLNSEQELHNGVELDPDDEQFSTPKAYVDPREAPGTHPDELHFVKTNTSQPNERVLPCYRAFTNTCDAGNSCTYSHDRAVLAAYGEQRLLELLRSPYVTPTMFENAAKRKQQPAPSTPAPSTPARQHMPTQDARRLPTGRSHGHVRIMQHPLAEADTVDGAASSDDG
jgi:hypothetical protein